MDNFQGIRFIGLMKDIFHLVEKLYNLRNNSTVKRTCNSSVAPKICQLVPNAVKNATSLEFFDKETKL